jgi:membrane protein YdbS with pleckstrin-like domain
LSDPSPKPVWKTGWLWGILAFLLMIGTVGAATFVYGLTGLVAGDALSAIAMGFGALVAILAFLFMAGVLYRVDKYRGTPQRRVELFE